MLYNVETIPINWVTLLLSGGAVLLALRLYQTLVNPLRHVPGPWYSKFTSLPGTIASMSHRQVQHYHSLHEQYGPFVRTGPNEVLISDITAYKQIHKIGSGFVKSDFYHYFGPTEAGSPPYGLFQMTSVADHSQRRKLLGRGFSVSALRSEWETMTREKVSAAVDGMADDGNVVDIRKWWIWMASDVVSHVMFGKSFDQLKARKQDSWFDEVKPGGSAAFFAYSMPSLYFLVSRLPILRNSRMFHSWKILQARGDDAIHNIRSSNGSHNAFAHVFKASEANTLTDEEVRVEAAAFMIAGSDTTSNTLTYLIYATLNNPGVRDALMKELDALDDFTDATLEACIVLSAVITETLRLYNAAPTPFPRVVPPSGAELGGHFIPGGTVVMSQSWSIHRDPAIFPDPDRFDYTRWLPDRVTEAATASFVPFGAGTRACIGKHLAMMELRYGTAMFFKKFPKAQLAPETTPESMEMRNLVLIEPMSGVCKVVLNPGKA